MDEPTLWFLSHEPKVGSPSYKWNDFKAQKLRKYPKPPSSLRFRNYVGAGIEGVVLRARTEDNEEVAVKIVRTTNGSAGVELSRLLTIFISTFVTSNQRRGGGSNASFPSSGNAATVRSSN